MFKRQEPNFRDTDATPVYESQDYVVRIGVIKDESLDVYVVQNKATGVVEFAHEVLSLAKEWVDHFTKQNHPEVEKDADTAAKLRLAN